MGDGRTVLGARAANRVPELLASARNALLVTAGLSTLAAMLLLVLLFRHEFAVRYVYEHVSTYLKPAYVLAAFWAGLEGSQLLWLWLLALFDRHPGLCGGPRGTASLRPYAMAVLAFTQAFFALLLVVLTNPFALLPDVPAEGVSLNPLLQNFWMIVHPPIVFAAYALWTIPFAYGLGRAGDRPAGCGLAAGLRAAGRWRPGPPWASASWSAPGGPTWSWAGAATGAGTRWRTPRSSRGWWAPHCSTRPSSRSGADMFRAWNVLLAALTFVLTIFATFVTRSGLIQSVHAFAESPIGYYYLGYMLLVLAVTVGLMLARRRELQGTGAVGRPFVARVRFPADEPFLLGSAAAVWLGTLWPTLTEAVRHVTSSLGPENYNRFMGPLGLLLVLLDRACVRSSTGARSAPARLLRSLWIQAVVALLTAVLLAPVRSA